MPEDKKNENNHEEASQGQGTPIKVKIKSNGEAIRVTDKRFWVQPQEGKEEEETSLSLKPSYVEALEKKLSDSHKKLDEIVASYREFRAESGAEIRKVRERIQNEYEKRLAHAKAEVSRKFIGILENLERALAASDEAPNFDSLLEGVNLIRTQFAAALADLGMEEVSVLRQPFNPEVAEAVETVGVESEAEDDLVLEVVAKGYRLDGILVRPAQVKVGKLKTPVS